MMEYKQLLFITRLPCVRIALSVWNALTQLVLTVTQKREKIFLQSSLWGSEKLGIFFITTNLVSGGAGVLSPSSLA